MQCNVHMLFCFDVKCIECGPWCAGLYGLAGCGTWWHNYALSQLTKRIMVIWLSTDKRNCHGSVLCDTGMLHDNTGRRGRKEQIKPTGLVPKG